MSKRSIVIQSSPDADINELNEEGKNDGNPKKNSISQ